MRIQSFCLLVFALFLSTACSVNLNHIPGNGTGLSSRTKLDIEVTNSATGATPTGYAYQIFTADPLTFVSSTNECFQDRGAGIDDPGAYAIIGSAASPISFSSHINRIITSPVDFPIDQLVVVCAKGFFVHSGGTHEDVEIASWKKTAPSPYEIDLATIEGRKAHHGFPRLGNNTQTSWEGNSANGFLGENLFKRLHWYDYSVVDSDAATQTALANYLGMNGPIRSKNPHAVIAAYFSPADFVNFDIRWRKLMRTYAWGTTYNHITDTDSDLTDGFQEALWLFKTITGEYVKLWSPDGVKYSLLQDIRQPGLRQHFVKTFNDVIVSTERVDGIYHDWANATVPILGHPSIYQIDIDGDGISDYPPGTPYTAPINVQYRAGMSDLYYLGRLTYPENFLMVGNAGWFNEPAYSNQLQGIMLENFNEAVASAWLKWGDSMYSYASYVVNGQNPNFSILQVSLPLPGEQMTGNNLYMDRMQSENNVWFTESQKQTLRFGLASALMFDGYYSPTNHGQYHAAYWMDEFSVNLSTRQSVYPASENDMNHLQYKGWMGQPLGEAFNIADSNQTLWSVLQSGKGNSADLSVWRRDFTNAVVLVNPTQSSQTIALETDFYKVQGVIDSVNDGTLVQSVTLPKESGIVLIRAGQ